MVVEGYSDGWMTKHSRIHSRRKFRSQSSDTMERWIKAEVGRVREEKRRREKVRDEKESEVQVREKVEKS